jgi:hypothetical protein
MQEVSADLNMYTMAIEKHITLNRSSSNARSSRDFSSDLRTKPVRRLK